MAIKLEFLGVGAGFSVGLGNNNAIIYDDTPENGYWCIDLGETSRVKLVERGLADKCKGVIVTHLHGDHIYGLEMMGFWWRFVKHKRLRVACGSREMLDGLGDILSGTMKEIQDSHGNPVEGNFSEFFAPMVYRPGDFMQLKFPSGTVDVQFVLTKHVPNKESFSVRLKVGDKIHYFTGDTREDLSSVEHNTLWHDAQLYDGGKGGVHTFIGELRDRRKFWDSEKREYVPDKYVRHEELFLMHYNRVPTEKEVEEAETWCGGFVKPGQVFDL